MTSKSEFNSLDEVVGKLRQELEDRKYLLLYAYNGTGKTRLSMRFKDAGKTEEKRDTLYYNAFTEDLFFWNNDLDDDKERRLNLNTKSTFFNRIEDVEMDSRVKKYLNRYVDFGFKIYTDDWTVRFWRDIADEEKDSNVRIEDIKISRGEESIFIWCLFLAIVEIEMEKPEEDRDFKYLYIDDPVSSLDDNNIIIIACQLASLIKNKENSLKVVISSHHTLFFNVMWNELQLERKKFMPYFFKQGKTVEQYILKYTKDTPFFHHVALLENLIQAANEGQLYTYHFNMLRTILEKTASFHGFSSFKACLPKGNTDDPDEDIYERLIGIMNHGDYSLFEPLEMMSDNKDHFKKMLKHLLTNYKFDSSTISTNLILDTE